MRHSRLIMLLASALTVSACGGGGGGSPPPPAPPPPPPPPATAFVDATAASGLAYDYGYRISPPPIDVVDFGTPAAAAGDYDSDGDIDLFVTRGDIGANLLYQNNGAGVFTDVAAAAGVDFTANASENYRHGGPAFADMDGDGHPDLFIGGLFGDPSFIYRNNGDGTFTDVTDTSGIGLMQAEHSVSTAFGDYDQDGDLDMFISHWGSTADENSPGDTDHLWRNDSVGQSIVFTGVSVDAGIAPSIITLPDDDAFFRPHDHTFSASFVRIDDDLYPDIVSVADYDRTMVFMNNGNNTFDNVTDVAVITDGFGMGSALGDYDDDGDIDWFVSSILDDPATTAGRDGNRLYRNDNGVFVDATSGDLFDGGWGWGACFIDFENDGDLDIYHTNGWSEGVFATDASRAFVSDGAGGFTEQATALGLDDTEQGRGVVCADFDGDGDTDIFQLHRGTPVAGTLWRNDEADDNNYLAVKLSGTQKNTEAAGARIRATIGARTMTREIIIGSNFQSQNPTLQIFGLGTESQVDELSVEWPDGNIVDYGPQMAGQTLELTQP